MDESSGLETTAGGAILLPDRLDLGAARRLRRSCLDADGDIAVDAGSVAVATTPAFQVLLAACDRQAARGRRFVIEPVSNGFAACARILGIPLSRLNADGRPS